jgi:DNA-binding transcriptional ArsR family regulator
MQRVFYERESKMVATLPDLMPYNPTDMVRAHSLGEGTRARIMRAIREREAEGLPPRGVRSLSRYLGMDHAGILRHLGTLADAGELEVYEPAEGIRIFRLPRPE